MILQTWHLTAAEEALQKPQDPELADSMILSGTGNCWFSAPQLFQNSNILPPNSFFHRLVNLVKLFTYKFILWNSIHHPETIRNWKLAKWREISISQILFTSDCLFQYYRQQNPYLPYWPIVQEKFKYECQFCTLMEKKKLLIVLYIHFEFRLKSEVSILLEK